MFRREICRDHENSTRKKKQRSPYGHPKKRRCIHLHPTTSLLVFLPTPIGGNPKPALESPTPDDERVFVSSPSIRQIFATAGESTPSNDDLEAALDPLSPLARGNIGVATLGARGIKSSYSSIELKSPEEVVVLVGESDGLCTISCRNEGRSGAAVGA